MCCECATSENRPLDSPRLCAFELIDLVVLPYSFYTFPYTCAFFALSKSRLTPVWFQHSKRNSLLRMLQKVVSIKILLSEFIKYSVFLIKVLFHFLDCARLRLTCTKKDEGVYCLLTLSCCFAKNPLSFIKLYEETWCLPDLVQI